jgi:hypothetical protein
MDNQRGTLHKKVFVEPIREWSFFKGDRVRLTCIYRSPFNDHVFCTYMVSLSLFMSSVSTLCGRHGVNYVGFEVLTVVTMKSSVFWDITLSGESQQTFWRNILSPYKRKPSKKPAACLMLVSCMAFSLTLKVEMICSSEMSLDFHQTTQCYIPEDRTLHVLNNYVFFV